MSARTLMAAIANLRERAIRHVVASLFRDRLTFQYERGYAAAMRAVAANPRMFDFLTPTEIEAICAEPLSKSLPPLGEETLDEYFFKRACDYAINPAGMPLVDDSHPKAKSIADSEGIWKKYVQQVRAGKA